MQMQKQPLISVIIPAFNVAPYIEECLESVRSQSYANFEAIVINDGSTDETREVVQQTIENDDRFVLLSQVNAGLSATRNRGMKLAKGDYIYFLDSDDRITSDFFQSAINEMTLTNLDLLTFNARSFIENSFITEGFDANNYVRNVPNGCQDPIQYLIQTKQFRSPVWLYLYRTDFLRSNDLWFREGILHEDESFSLIACVTAKRTAFLDSCFFERRVRKDSIMTSKKSFKNTQSYFEVFKETALWYLETDYDHSKEYAAAIEERIAMFYMWALRGAISREELARFRKIALPSFSLILKFARLKNALAILFPKRICSILAR